MFREIFDWLADKDILGTRRRKELENAKDLQRAWELSFTSGKSISQPIVVAKGVKEEKIEEPKKVKKPKREEDPLSEKRCLKSAEYLLKRRLPRDIQEFFVEWRFLDDEKISVAAIWHSRLPFAWPVLFCAYHKISYPMYFGGVEIQSSFILPETMQPLNGWLKDLPTAIKARTMLECNNDAWFSRYVDALGNGCMKFISMDAVRSRTCPSCGAPIESKTATGCKYCGAGFS